MGGSRAQGRRDHEALPPSPHSKMVLNLKKFNGICHPDVHTCVYEISVEFHALVDLDGEVRLVAFPFSSVSMSLNSGHQ